MMMQPITPPLEAVSQRVEALQSTAEYIEVLLEIVQETIRSANAALRSLGHPVPHLGDWRQVETLLNLAHDQTAIIHRTCNDFEETRIAAVRR